MKAKDLFLGVVIFILSFVVGFQVHLIGILKDGLEKQQEHNNRIYKELTK